METQIYEGSLFLVPLLAFYTVCILTLDKQCSVRVRRPKGSYHNSRSGEIDDADPACLEQIPPGSAAGKYNNRTSAGVCHTGRDRVRRRWFSSGIAFTEFVWAERSA